jgi:hypothetical protein
VLLTKKLAWLQEEQLRLAGELAKARPGTAAHATLLRAYIDLTDILHRRMAYRLKHKGTSAANEGS